MCADLKGCSRHLSLAGDLIVFSSCRQHGLEPVVGCLVNPDRAVVQYRGGTSTHKQESVKGLRGAAAVPMETTFSS